MASTYSTNLALELIGTGDQAGTWGVTTNTNLGTLLEQAISGYVTQAVSTGADTTITIPNGSTGVARNMYIEMTGTGGTNTNLIVPANKKLYFIFNNASGAVTVKVSGQTGVNVPAGKKMILVSNGTDIVNGVNYIADFGTNSFTVTNLTATSATITNLIATTASVSDLSATVLRSASATLTHLSATSASITNLALTSLTISSLNITNVTVASATVSSNLTLSAGTANGVLYLNGSKAATSGSALVFDGTNFGVGTASPGYKLNVSGSGYTLGLNGGGTTRVAQTFGNTGGGLDLGIEGSAGGTVFTGSSAYASVIGSNNSTVLQFGTNGTIRATLDTSGNLGLGVTPRAWGSNWRSYDAYGNGAFASSTAGNTSVVVSNGAYNDNTNWKYIYTGIGAALYTQNQNIHEWRVAASGTAGNTITFTQAMTLAANGALALNSTTNVTSISGQRSGTNHWFVGDVNAALGSGAGLMNYTYGADPILFYTNGSERARITATGGFALGTTTDPGAGNMIFSGSASTIYGSQTSGDRSYIELYNPSTGDMSLATTYSTAVIKFLTGTSPTERARITSGGELLVGTTDTAGSAGVGVKLHPTGGIYAVSTTSISDNYNYYNSTAGAYRFYVTNGGTIYATNTTISAISDQRLKENVRDLDVGLSAIMALKPRKFDWKEGKGKEIKNDRGFIAQEFEQVFPDLVDNCKDPTPEGEAPYKSVRQDLIPVLVKAIQEQQAMINELKAEVAALKGV